MVHLLILPLYISFACLLTYFLFTYFLPYLFTSLLIYTVSQKNDTALACHNLDIYQPILISFGRNVAKKVRSQTVL